MAPTSISAYGVVERLFYAVPGLWSVFTAPLVARAVTGLLGLGTYLLASTFIGTGRGRSDASWDYAFGLAVLVRLLGSPLTEDAHLSLALIPLAVCVAPMLTRLARGERGAWLPLALCGLFFVYVTLPVRSQASFATYTGWHTVWSGYWFYGLAGLTALYVWTGRRVPTFDSGPSVLRSAWHDVRHVRSLHRDAGVHP
jgi:hypothetical protein